MGSATGIRLLSTLSSQIHVAEVNLRGMVHGQLAIQKSARLEAFVK